MISMSVSFRNLEKEWLKIPKEKIPNCSYWAECKIKSVTSLVFIYYWFYNKFKFIIILIKEFSVKYLESLGRILPKESSKHWKKLNYSYLLPFPLKKLMYINDNYCQFLLSSDSGLCVEVCISHLVTLNVNILILEWIIALPKLTMFFCIVLPYHFVSYYSISYYDVLTMVDRKKFRAIDTGLE